MVTRILFDPRRDLPDGTTQSNPVIVTATPTGIAENGQVVVLPTSLSFTIATSADLLQLPASAASWKWRLAVRDAVTSVLLQQRTVLVPDQASIGWADLPDVDPTSLGDTVSHARNWDATFAHILDLMNGIVAGELNDAAVATLVATPASATALALAASLSATYVPFWKANTAYASGAFALSPTGQVVQANTAFTSGSTYNAANWTVVAGGTGGSGAVSSVAGKIGAVVLVPADVSLGNVNNTSDAAKPISTAQAAVNAAKADLVSGLIPTSQIPALALTTVVPVATRAAMLALTSAQVQPGDFASVAADPGKGTYGLTAADPSQLSNWVLTNSPTDVVLTVNGQQGTVVLAKSDLGLGSVDNTADASKPVSAAQQAAISALSLSLPVTAISSNATAVIGARNSVTATAGPIAITMPTPTAVGQHLIIERADTSTVAANVITITGTIRGVANTAVTLPAVGAAYEGALYISESLTSWAIAGSIKPRAVLDAAYAALTIAGQEDLATQNDAAMRVIRAALARVRRGKGRAVIAVIGDSKSEGQNSDVGATYADTWPRYLQASLRGRLGVTGGDSYVPFWYGRFAPATQEFTYTGTANVDYSVGWFQGIGMRSIHLLTTAAVLTITRKLSSFELHYSNYAAGTVINVSVDGGAYTNVITTDGNGGNRTWVSPVFGAATNHVVTVSRGTGSTGDPVVGGIHFHADDESVGIDVIDGARYGQTASSFSDNLEDWTRALNYTSPDLVIIRLGANDMVQYSAATYQAKMLNLLSGAGNSINARLTKKPSYLLVVPEQGTQATIDPYQSYIDATYALLSGVTSAAILDLSKRMPQDSASNPLGLIGADSLHETSVGYQYVAELVERMISPVSAPTVGTTVNTSVSSTAFDAADLGMQAWTTDLALVTGALLMPTASATLTRMKVASTGTPTNVNYRISSTGSGVTAGSILIFKTDGTLLCKTGDLSATFNSTGLKTSPFTTSAALTKGQEVWVVLWCAGTTGPTLQATIATNLLNGSLTAASPYRVGRKLTVSAEPTSVVTTDYFNGIAQIPGFYLN